MPDHDLDLSPREATAILDEVDRLRVGTRQAWSSPWFAFVCFASITLLGGVALVLLGPIGSLLVWVLLGPAGMVLVGRHHRQRARAAGITGRPQFARRWSWAAFAACFAIAALVGAHSHAHDAGVVASILCVLAAYVLFSLWQHRGDAALFAALAALAPLILAAVGTGPWLVEIVFGAALVVAGVGVRARTAAP